MALETVMLETIILQGDEATLVQNINAIWEKSFTKRPQMESSSVNPLATREGVPGDVYDAGRRGLATCCADVVLVMAKDGEPKVPLIRRARPPFGGCWWVMGGAVFNYRSLSQFVLWKAVKETGLTKLGIADFFTEHPIAGDEIAVVHGIGIAGCLGLFRTVAGDMEGTGKVCDTINTCHMGVITQPLNIFHDRDHDAVRWFSKSELESDADVCGHWYPREVAMRALAIYQVAKDRLADQASGYEPL